jgi:ribosomal protein S18 acetylase RimI-like enzyme
MSVDAALDRVVDFYRGLGRPALIDIPLPLASDVRDAVAGRGWECVSRVHVLVADIATGRAAVAVPLLDRPSPDHLEQIADARGLFPPAALHVLTAVAPVAFAEVRDGSGALVGRGRGAVTDGWLGIFTVATAPAARRTGMASAVMGALCGWGALHGATGVYLQVEAGNSGALALYERLGFTESHTYVRYSACD